MIVMFCNKNICRVKFIHQRKLRNLGYDCNDQLTNDKVIFNYSSRVLSTTEKSLLSKGLKYVVSHGKLNYLNHFITFEKFFKTLSGFDFYDYNSKGFDHFKQMYKNLAFSIYYGKRPDISTNLTKEEIVALKMLSREESIVIIRPDKGNGIVILDKTNYIEKMMEILNDYQKFEKVEDDTFAILLRCEDKLNRYLRTLKANDIISKELYSELHATGSQPGIIYGLPKIHKPNCPLRPILSAIGTHNYKLSKYLVPILAPLTINEYTVKDSFTFAKELTSLNYTNCVMASFDVKSLFTNIPLRETIDICVDGLFSDTDLSGNFTKVHMKKLLSLAVHDCHFIFNGIMYKQIEGAAMGSPLSASLANVFLAYQEKRWLNDCPPEFRPLMYRRYVDDTFVIFRSPDHIPHFLKYLNSQHENIQFKSESESNNKLPFLDILIEKHNGSFQTSTYRKPTYTGLTTKFTSFIPNSYKRNLIYTLLNRAYKICSNYHLLHKEIQFIKNTLLNNEFTSNFVDKYIGKQLSRLLEQPSPKKTTVEKAVAISS